LLNLLWVVGIVRLSLAYFPEQRRQIEQEELGGLTEPSFLGFIFPVPDKWQALVLRVEVGLVSTLFVVGAAFLLKLLLSMEEGVLGLILWLIICGVIGKGIMEMYVPNLRAWKLGSHERES
jgi:hypothetical protein